MSEIVLPAGTKWVPVDEVPGLLAAAQYPPVQEGRAVSYLLKKLGDGRELPLQDDDEFALASAWEGLPPYAGAAESEWPRYAAAFAAIPRNKRPPWQLVPVWRNCALNARMQRLITEDEHREWLKRFVLMGEVQVVGLSGNPSIWGRAARMSVDVLRAYAERYRVEVKVAPDKEPAEAVSVVVTGDRRGTDEAAPLPLTTCEIAFCFAGLRWKTEKEWKKPLGYPPKWLKSCVAIPGRRGGLETRWDPVRIGAALVHAGHAPAKSVRARFQTKPLLKPWLEAWKTYEAENLDTD